MREARLAVLFLSSFVLPSILLPSVVNAQTKPRVQVPATSRTQAQALVQQLLREGKIMRARDAKRGMKGYAISVFQGTTLEKFPVEIIGVLESVNGGGDFVMFRVTGGTVVKRQSGIVQGMSGSPVYINGKLLGAIAIGFGFPKEPIGGITPITDMIATTLPDPSRARLAPTPKPTPQKPAAPSTRSSVPRASMNNEIELHPREALNVAGRRIARVVVSRDRGRPAFSGAMHGATMTMRPTSLRLQLSGWSVSGAQRMNDLLSPYGMETSLIAPSGGMRVQAFGPSSKKSGVNPPFVAGGAIGAQLVSGDMDMTGVGTITYRIGNRVLAFGHPMLGAGSISLPMTSAYVHDIFPSYETSFKLASPVRTVGSVQQDTNYAIGGTIGTKADTVPMTVFIRNASRQIAKTYRVQIMKDPVLTPNLITSVAAEMLATTLGQDSDKMVRVALTMRLKNQKPIVRRNYLYGTGAPIGTFSPGQGQVGAGLLDLYEAIMISQTSEFGRGAIESVSLNLEVLPVRKTARIKNIFADRNKIKAGETVRVSVELEPSETPGKTITKTFDFTVPADAPSGVMRIGASSSNDYYAVSTRVGEAPPMMQNLPELLTAYEKVGATDELAVQISTPRTYLVVDNKRVPSPPASFSRLMRGGSSNIAAYNETQIQKERVEYSLSGLQLLALPVESSKHSDRTSPDATGTSTENSSSSSSRTTTTPAAPSVTTDASDMAFDESATTPFSAFPSSITSHLLKTPLMPTIKPGGFHNFKSNTRLNKSRLQRNSFEYSFNSNARRSGFMLTSAARNSDTAVTPTPENPIAPSASEIMQPTPSVPVASPIASPSSTPAPTPIASPTPSPTPTDNGTNLSRPSLRWIQNATADFLRGDFEGTQVSSEGIIGLSPRTRRILTTPEPFAWSVASDKMGNTYIGTGNNARLYKVSPNDKSRVLYDGDEVAITALTTDDKGNLYAAVAPGGKVLRFAPDSTTPVMIIDTKEAFVWALKFDAQGRLLVATGGEKGKLYRLSESVLSAPEFITIDTKNRSLTGNPKSNLFTTIAQKHIRAITIRGNDIFIGTGESGVLYRVDGTTGKTTALYEATVNSPAAITLAPSGDLSAAIASLSGATSGTADSSEILAVAATDDGVYFGTANNGTLYRWTEREGVTAIYPSPQNSIYAIAAAPDGALYVATGEKGVVYRVKPGATATDAVGARVLEPTQTQALALDFAANGDLLVGTGNNAAAYRADLKNINTGSFTSNVFDAKNVVQWGALRTSGTGARWQTRSGNTLEPDTTWSAWQDTARNDLDEIRVASPPARYLQYRALLNADAINKQPQFSRIEVVYRTNNTAPQVVWTAPTGSEYVHASAKASWTAQDADNDKLRYTLSISADDGATWQNVALKDATANNFDLDTTKFKDGTYRLKIEASDASANPEDPQSATKISEPFTIDNTAPQVFANIREALSGSAGQARFDLRSTTTDAASPISGAEWRFFNPAPKAKPKVAPATTNATRSTTSTRGEEKASTEAAITIVSQTTTDAESKIAEVNPTLSTWNAMAPVDGIFDSRREELVARPTDADVDAARKAGIVQIEIRVRDAAGNSATTRVDLPQ